ncbi:MAG: TRAP transporter small permease [Lachnospiraceae bacterium]|nr:TRAP transporter small permease [Lachnospiraceae bacterium]
MDGVKKVGQFLRNCVELYIPICAFLIMFVVFVIEIAARYVFNNPLPWAYEVTVMCYLWLVILGACFAYRDRSHVTFTLIYDKLGTKGKAVCALLGNVLMLIAFIAMFIPSVDFIMQMKIQVTSVFKIGLNIVYLPFIPFMVIMICYFLYDIFVEIMAFMGNQKYIDLMLKSTKSETEEAIEMAMAEGKEADR